MVRWWLNMSKKAITVTCNLSSAFAQLSAIQKQASDVIRSAVFAGTKMVFSEVQIRAPQSEHAHWFYSKRKSNGDVGNKYLFKSGSLKKSLYIKYLPEISEDGISAIYQISWRKRPSDKGYVPYAHMVEYGTIFIPPAPFVRPAFDAKKEQAEQLIFNLVLSQIGKTEHGRG